LYAQEQAFDVMTLYNRADQECTASGEEAMPGVNGSPTFALSELVKHWSATIAALYFGKPNSARSACRVRFGVHDPATRKAMLAKKHLKRSMQLLHPTRECATPNMRGRHAPNQTGLHEATHFAIGTSAAHSNLAEASSFTILIEALFAACAKQVR
jgi:hypothetical protein